MVNFLRLSNSLQSVILMVDKPPSAFDKVALVGLSVAATNR